jgi:hypothetical protein
LIWEPSEQHEIPHNKHRVSEHQATENNLSYAHSNAIDFFELFTRNVSNIGFNIRTAFNQSNLKTASRDDVFFSGHGTTAELDGSLAWFRST